MPSTWIVSVLLITACFSRAGCLERQKRHVESDLCVTYMRDVMMTKLIEVADLVTWAVNGDDIQNAWVFPSFGTIFKQCRDAMQSSTDVPPTSLAPPPTPSPSIAPPPITPTPTVAPPPPPITPTPTLAPPSPITPTPSIAPPPSPSVQPSPSPSLAPPTPTIPPPTPSIAPPPPTSPPRTPSIAPTPPFPSSPITDLTDSMTSVDTSIDYPTILPSASIETPYLSTSQDVSEMYTAMDTTASSIISPSSTVAAPSPTVIPTPRCPAHEHQACCANIPHCVKRFNNVVVLKMSRCPAHEHQACRQWSNIQHCARRFNNVAVLKMCPYLCGTCLESERPTCANDPNCHRSDFGCEYQGVRPTAAQCKTYGRDGVDRYLCETNNPPNPCDWCRKHPIKTYAQPQCPVMCGLCDHPCGTKRCVKDQGKMDVATCECVCYLPFRGETCSERFCPVRDAVHCFGWKAEYCVTYAPAVPRLCPYLCGVCQENERPACETDPYCHNTGGCEYIGKTRPTQAECAVLGDNGADMSFCNKDADKTVTPGAYTCHECYWVRDGVQKCPIMCSACDPPGP